MVTRDLAYEQRVRDASIAAITARLRVVHHRMTDRARRRARSAVALRAYVREALREPDEVSIRMIQPEVVTYLAAARSSASPALVARHLIVTYQEALGATLLEEVCMSQQKNALAAFERAVGRLEVDVVTAAARALDERGAE